MRRRVAISLLVMLGALLAWRAVRRAPAVAVDPPSATPSERSAPARFEPVPAPAKELFTPAERAVKEAAITHLAAVTGRFAVLCPRVPNSDGASWSYPEAAICSLSSAVTCAMAQPKGSVVVRRHPEPTPVAVVVWDTGPDGVTTCVVEAPSESRVRVRVLDPQGSPRAGAEVIGTDLSRSATTGEEGWATFRLLGTGTEWVMALGDDGAVSAPVAVAPGGEATLVLGDRPADLAFGEVMSEVRTARRVEAIEELEAALESATPEVAAELGEILDGLVRAMNGVCETSNVPTCRVWSARH